MHRARASARACKQAPCASTAPTTSGATTRSQSRGWRRTSPTTTHPVRACPHLPPCPHLLPSLLWAAPHAIPLCPHNPGVRPPFPLTWSLPPGCSSLAPGVHPIPKDATLGPPGWGGAYAGSKPRCYASHDLGPRAQPQACDFSKPFSTSESFEPYGQWPKPHPAAAAHWLS